jgi:hypothetical protein
MDAAVQLAMLSTDNPTMEEAFSMFCDVYMSERDFSAALEEIILRCLEKVPEMRFQDGSQMASVVEPLAKN